jgi:hypothetical protein
VTEAGSIGGSSQRPTEGKCITVPSWVTPGTYLDNVRYVDQFPEIDGIELLFYYCDEATLQLFRGERDRIAAYRRRFSFSVHLPDAITPSHEELVALTDDLAERYIVHPPPESGSGCDSLETFISLVTDWRARYGDRFILENLIDRNMGVCLEQLEDIPVCLDTGHLLLSGQSVEAFLRELGSRIREIHLHGVRDGQDHRPFSREERWFVELVPFLREYRGVLHLEVFSIEEVKEILNQLSLEDLVF